tara:strand:- start:363 stop:638 length:276 start_codon:yes stop_codon:yes gene_type:complete
MKIIDVYTKIADSLKEDNPLKNIGNKETTEIFNAKYYKYSSRGCHFVEYNFISPEWNRAFMEPLDKICSNEVMFTNKTNALKFIKLVNNGN